MNSKHSLSQILIYGCLSLGLYTLLYLYSERILEASRQGHWNFIQPILIAFAFSFVHGHFTGHFWDLLGFKAKSVKK